MYISKFSFIELLSSYNKNLYQTSINNYNNWLIILIFFILYEKFIKKVDLFLLMWCSKTVVTTLVLSQVLKNSCSDYIRKFQVLWRSVVSERVRDSTKAYRPIYKCGLLDLNMWGCIFNCICDEKYDCLRLNGVDVFVCCLCVYRMTNSRLEVRIFCLFKKNVDISSYARFNQQSRIKLLQLFFFVRLIVLD